MFDYIQLPNKIFYTTKDDEQNIIKIIKNDKKIKYDNNIILILDYLYINTNRKDITIFTIEDLILSCGFKEVDRHKGRNLEQFKIILNKLKDLNIISYKSDFINIKPAQLIKCKLNLINENEGYIQLFDYEKDKILQSNVTEIDNKKLLTYYCYLKARMYKRSNNEGDLVVNGGRAEVTWVGYRTIADDLSMDDRSIKKYNDALIQLSLIRIENAGLWYYKNDKEKIVKESNNIYTLYTENDTWKENLKEGVKYYKEQGRKNGKVFETKKEYKNNNRKLNGELGSIIKKEKNGTATIKDLKRKKEIIDLTNDNMDIKYKIIQLLSDNEEMMLSEIYDNTGKNELANFYYDLELSLGLINNNGNLLVDYEYYKWIMVNYKDDEHDYYANCVNSYRNKNYIT